MKFPSIFSIMTIVIMAFLMSACSSTSEDNSSSVLTLSSTSAAPGEFITLTHGSFKVDTPVTVTWSDGGDFTIHAQGYPMVDNELKIPVPAYFSLETNVFTEGNVSVAISGITETKSLTIRKPIKIIYAGEDKPGVLMIEWMKQNIVAYQNIILNLQSFDVDTSEAQASHLAEISSLEAVIAEYAATGTFTQYAGDGTAHVLTEQELRTADISLYSTVLGILQVSEETSLLATSVNPTQAEGLFGSTEADSTDAKPLLQQVRDGLKSTDGIIRKGAKVLLAITGLAAGVGVLTAAAAATSAASSVALGLAGLSGAVYIVIVGTHSEVSAFLTHQTNVSEGRVDDYQFGQAFYDVTVDAGKDLAFSVAGYAAGTVGTIAGVIKDGWSIVKTEVKSICDTLQNSEPYTPLLSTTTLADEEAFCTEIEVIYIHIDSFDFSINIPGYTGPFNKERIAFGLGTVNDGPPTYPAVAAISTLTEFDPLNDDFVGLIFSTELSAGSYTVDDTWITDGGTVDVTFSSGEILEDISTGYKWPVAFTQTGGTLELEYYGTSYGDRLKGSFSVTVQGDKTTCFNTECDTEGVDYIVETITGTISGTFDGYIKEDPAASSSVSLSSSLIKK